MQWVDKLRPYLPRRRRRMWRYVSTGRRGAGWVIFLTLVSLIYLYWHMTNPQRVREMATAYLEELTGVQVRVDYARFSLFGPIELGGVYVFTDSPATSTSQPASGPTSSSATAAARSAKFAGGPLPLLKADRVILRHRALSLLLRQRVQPTDIVFVQPEITIEHYTPDGSSTPEYEYNVQQLFRHRPTSSGGLTQLPRISVQNCRLNSVEVLGTARVAMTETHWNITITPEGKNSCRIIIAPVPTSPQTTPVATGTTRPGHVECLINLATGQIEGDLTIGPLASALPLKYRQWREQFGIAGQLRIAARTQAASRSRMDLELLDVTLKIPEDQAGLTLTNVRGTVRFEESRVTLERVSGRIVETGGTFLLDGYYEGYRPTSPFEMTVNLRGVSVPTQRLPGTSRLAGILDVLRRWYSPEGPADVDIDIQRTAEGKVLMTGVANLDGMSMTHKSFPYRVHDVRGPIRFDTREAHFDRLTCRRDGGRATIVGTASLAGQKAHDVTITAEDISCDETLLAALPQKWHTAWKAVDPGGTFGATVRIVRTGPKDRTDVQVDLDANGQTTMAYQAFPYRITLTAGRIRFRKDLVAIESLRGARGTMQCRIDGILSALGSENAFIDVTAETRPGRAMPIDEALLSALGPKAAQAVRELHITGEAQLVAHITQGEKQPLAYHAKATLANVTLKPDVFAYQITDGTGELDITAEQILVKRFAGRHGPGVIELIRPDPARKDFPPGPMRIDLTGKTPAVYLALRTGQLPMDDDLRAALPQSVRKIWDQFKPSGKGAVTGAFWNNTPEHGPEMYYELDVHAHGVDAVYEKFPHPLRKLTGGLHAVPGLVTLQDLASQPAQTPPADATGRADLTRSASPAARIDGTVAYTDTTTRVKLAVHAPSVGITKEILEAMPRGTASITRRLRPGGTCDVNLKTLHVEVMDAHPATTSAPAREAATTWALNGSLTFHDGVLVLGPQTQTFSGSLKGRTDYDGKDIDLAAALGIDRVRIGQRTMTHLQAEVRKASGSSLVKLQDFSAEAYGGRMAGTAELRMDEPIGYGVSLSVNELQLADLVRGEGGGDKPMDVSGLLTGNIQITGTMGKPEAARATGVMQISTGKLYRLPVLLGLLQVVTLGLPGDAAFTEGNVNYRLEGRKLVFEEIYLSGPSLTIVGSGTLDMTTRQLKLRFLSGAQRKLPRLAVLDALLRAPFRELMEIHIDGPVDNPKIRTVSLVSLDTFLKQLLRPELKAP